MLEKFKNMGKALKEAQKYEGNDGRSSKRT